MKSERISPFWVGGYHPFSAQQVAKKLNIDLLEIVIQDKKIDEDNLLQAYNIVVTDRKLYDRAASSIRFALCCERIMVNKYYKPLVKDPKALHSYICANDFLYMVCEHSFFKTMYMNA